ncbi:MAG: chromate transporter [Clostridiaceae bacterium]|nr:chromate transporter [Clostridiaceae bacterium]
MNDYLDMFLTFARIGGLTFGGGYAMLPMLQKEVVENKHWATEEEIMDYYAIGQCLPGLIAVNTAAFIGQKRKGSLGGFICGMGVAFPSLIVITIIAAFIGGFADMPAVINAFAGIRVCVCVLIYNAVMKLWKKAIVDKKALVLFACIFLAAMFTDISPILFVIAAAVAGMIIHMWGLKKA